MSVAARAAPVRAVSMRAGQWHTVALCGMAVCLSLFCTAALHAQGLTAKPQDLAPNVLTVPGEAMLIDPEPEQSSLSEPPGAMPSGSLADEVGLASWYGAQFHRRRTASGERFDMRALTAAHPTLPFGTRVCVRSQQTGRSVIVRINDRGPHIRSRVIDLSRGAAEVLGVAGLGLKPVELFALDDDERNCPVP